MRFSELDVVKAKTAMPERGIAAGALGTVLLVYADHDPPAYEVEFDNEDGETIAQLAMLEDQLLPAA